MARILPLAVGFAFLATLNACSGCHDSTSASTAAEAESAAVPSAAPPVGSDSPRQRGVAAPLLHGRGPGAFRPDRLRGPVISASAVSGSGPAGGDVKAP